MLEPHEWAVVEEARDAGVHYAAVLDRARAQLGPSPSYTPLPDGMDASSYRTAYLTLGYELFTGKKVRALAYIPHHRTSLYGPECRTCGKPLRTPSAHSCVACGTPRADAPTSSECDADAIRLHRYDLRRVNVEQVLAAGPTILLSDRDRFGKRVMPWEEDAWLLKILETPAFGLITDKIPLPPLAAMVQRVTLLYNTLDADDLDQYLMSDGGDDLEQLASDARELGALRTVELVTSLLDLFAPHARSSEEDRSARLAELAEEGNDDPARELGIAHWDVLRELPRCMHEYVVQHLDEFEETLRQTRGVVANQPTDIVAIFHDAAQTVKRFQSLMPASQQKTFPPHTPDLPVGTVLEIRDENAGHAGLTFLQVTHHHELEPMLGPVVRVIEGWYDTRPSAIDDVVRRPTRAVALLPSEISPAHIATIVGLHPVPDADQRFPAFRSLCNAPSDEQSRWAIWQGGSRSVDWYSEPLPDEIARCPILGAPRPVQQIIK
jgi:hypothetical protein